jgi:hypothetical protein
MIGNKAAVAPLNALAESFQYLRVVFHVLRVDFITAFAGNIGRVRE